MSDTEKPRGGIHGNHFAKLKIVGRGTGTSIRMRGNVWGNTFGDVEIDNPNGVAIDMEDVNAERTFAERKKVSAFALSLMSNVGAAAIAKATGLA